MTQTKVELGSQASLLLSPSEIVSGIQETFPDRNDLKVVLGEILTFEIPEAFDFEAASAHEKAQGRICLSIPEDPSGDFHIAFQDAKALLKSNLMTRLSKESIDLKYAGVRIAVNHEISLENAQQEFLNTALVAVSNIPDVTGWIMKVPKEESNYFSGSLGTRALAARKILGKDLVFAWRDDFLTVRENTTLSDLNCITREYGAYGC